MDHLARFDVENDRTVLTKHLAHKWGDLRKYLVDYVLITRARPSYLEQEALIKSLRHLSTRGLKPQKFYSALLLKTGPPSVTKEDLGLSAKVFELVQRLAARKTARAPLLKKKPRS